MDLICLIYSIRSNPIYLSVDATQAGHKHLPEYRHKLGTQGV